VVSGSRPRAILESSPGWLVTVLEFFVGPAIVGKVACREDGSRNLVNQFGRRFGPRDVSAPGDITCPNERDLV